MKAVKAARLSGACIFIALTCLFNFQAIGQNRNGAIIDSTAVMNTWMNRSAFSLLISRSGSPNESDGTASWGGGMDKEWLRFQGKTLVSCLGFLLDLDPGTRIVVNDSAKGDTRIDVMFYAKTFLDSSFAGKYLPGKPNMNLILHMLSQAFDFSIRQTNEPAFHFQLVTIDTAKGRSSTWPGADATGLTRTSYTEIFNGGMEVDNQDIHSVAKSLESILHMPVTAFSADTTKYKLAINARSIGELNDQLSKHRLQLQDNNTDRVWKAYVTFR